MSTKFNYRILIILILGTLGKLAYAAPDTSEASDTATTETPAGETNLGSAIEAIQAQLKAQQEQIRELQTRYENEVASQKVQIAKQDKVRASQVNEIETQRVAMQSLQQQVDQVTADQQIAMTEEQKVIRARLETVEQSVLASEQQSSTEYNTDSFPGSIALPGTSAAIKISGFVKMNLVKSFDPLGTKDRFITSSIPVPDEGSDAEASLTSDPTRINLELRDTSDYGNLRAFVEGDFQGAADGFRLRHAFGQFNSMLIGKTWSTFMDPDTKPESLDFEGTNARLLARQSQIRYFPEIGNNWNLLLALEDSNPDITGGRSSSSIPDVVVSVERKVRKWHLKTAALYRKLDGTCDCLNETEDEVSGWAVTLSGSAKLGWWHERDGVKIQFNYGSGYGRYVNDLAELGGNDAVFNPTTGKLKPLKVGTFYVALQKWWSNSTRSTFNFGYVDVDNEDFQPEDAYQKTIRLSTNLIWSPTPRVDLGAELLTGRRWNKNNMSSNARQFQFAVKYRY